MVAFVRQFSGFSNTSTSTTTIVVPAGGIPAGHSLVLSIVTLTSTLPLVVTSFTASDARGNMYVPLHAFPITGNSTGVGMMMVNITSNLLAGDVITVSPNNETTRCAISVHEFDDVLQADVSATEDNDGAPASVLTTGATSPTAQANELVVGCFALVSPGRIFTLGSGFSEGTKVASTAGSGDRAIVAEYKLVASVGPQTATGTLNTGSIYTGLVQTFTYGQVSSGRTGQPKVWNGAAWVAHPAKVWNGTSWVGYKAKGYNGSTWIESK